MEEVGITRKYIKLVEACYIESSCQVRFANKMSESFNVRSGLRQGDPLSPVLFNIALEKVRREIGNGREMEIMGFDTVLAFADDVVIMGESLDQITSDTARFMKVAIKVGLVVNDE